MSGNRFLRKAGGTPNYGDCCHARWSLSFSIPRGTVSTAPNRKRTRTTMASAVPHSLAVTDDAHGFWLGMWCRPFLGWHKEDVNPHLSKYTDLLLGTDDDNGNVSDKEGNRIFVPLCGKSVDLAYLAAHPKISHVVGIDIVHNAAVDFMADYPDLQMEQVQLVEECRAEEDAKDEWDSNSETEARQSSPSVARRTFFGSKLTILIRDLFDLLPMNGEDRAKYLTEGIVSSKPTASVPSEYLFDKIYDRASIVAIKPSLRKNYVELMGQLLRPGGSILLVSLDRRKTTTDEAKLDGPPFSINEAEIRQLYESQYWAESVKLLEEVDDLTTDEDKKRWEKKGVLELYEMVYLIKKKV